MKRRLFALIASGLLCLSLALTCACGKTPDGSSSSGNQGDFTDLSVREASGKNGVVASANAYASKAGLEVLEAGGNAFDASVAVAFALGVVEPYASGVGGGGVMTAYDAKTDSYKFYNFREFVPAAGTADAYKAKGGNAALDHGITSVGVPTEVAGLCGIYEDLGSGKLTLAEVMEPAIRYANKGFTIEKTLAAQIKDAAFTQDEAFEVFYDGGIEPYVEGDTLVQENYGNVLEEIAKKGADGFYTGWVAEAIVAASEELGGFVTMEDLAYAKEAYPKVGEPLSGTYSASTGDYTVYTSNLPSSGGIILIETLNMLEAYCEENNTTIAELKNNSAEYIHVLNSALQLSYADKRKYIADDSESPDESYVSPITGTRKFVNVPMKGLMSKDYAAQRFLTQFKEDHSYIMTSSYDFGGADRSSYSRLGYVADASPWEYEPATTANATALAASEEGDEHWSTTSFSVTDKEGNIVSYTQTINHFWGAYVIPAGCGFFLNNQLSSFSLTKGNIHYVQPYAQPVSHIMPTILMKDGKPFATIGSPGSTRIPSAVTQVALNLMEFGMDIQSAINNPRSYTYCVTTSKGDNYDGWSSSSSKADYLPVDDRTKRLWLETTAGVPNAITQETCTALEGKAYNLKTYAAASLFFGGVQGITFTYDKRGNLVTMTGGADPRRDGKALAF